MRSSRWAVILAVLPMALRAEADSVVVSPLDAQAESQNGVDWTVDPTSDVLNASRFSSGLERRGVLEFPLEGIPAPAQITAVRIEIDIAGITHTNDLFPVIEFRGYAGDGVLTVGDALQAAPSVGATEPILSIDEMPVVTLDAAFVQSLIGSTTHLGLYTYQAVEGLQASFYSVEFADLFPVSPPQLTIEFRLPIVDGLIPVTDRRDLIWDRTRNVLYITTGGGTIERFDVGLRTLLAPFDLGVNLNGADITADGAYLYVASGADGLADASIRKVDLSSGVTTTLSFPRASGESDRWDIALGQGGIGLITARFGGSGRLPVRSVDLATDVIAEREDVPGSFQHEVVGRTKLSRSPDRSTIYLGEPGGTNPDIIRYDAETDTFPASTEASVGSNGVDAASRDGSFLARSIVGKVEFRNSSLAVVDEIGESYPGIAIQGGVTFHPTLPVLFVADRESDDIIAFSVPALEELFRIDVGESLSFAQAFDDGTMEMSHNGLLLFLSTEGGVRVFDIPNPGTEDCDANGIRDICDIDCASRDLITDAPCAEGVTCGTANDCTGNGIPDRCEPDCNFNQTADSCETATGNSLDCNGNGVPDECDEDCDFNGIPDECDLANGTREDCDGDHIPDVCQPDCDESGLPDVCEIFDDPSLDENDNGVLDVCDCVAGVGQGVHGVAEAGQDQFGFAVDMDASYAVISANSEDHAAPNSIVDAGAAYVYEETESGWTELQRLTAADAAEDQFFGIGAAVRGDTMFVGAPGDDALGDRAGAVYVFERHAHSFAQVDKLQASDGAGFDFFGYTVAAHGDWLFVGALNEGNSGVGDFPLDGPGAVYAFELDAGVWTERQKLTVMEGAPMDFFSIAMAVGDEIGVVGAPMADAACPTDPNCNSGAVYVFRLNQDGNWTRATTITPADAGAGHRFGQSVAVQGAEILIGAPRADALIVEATGAAYLFAFDGNVPASFVDKLTDAQWERFDAYGTAVALGGDVAIVGGVGADGATGGSGAAALFARIDGAWTFQETITPATGSFGHNFGGAVAIDQNRALIGSPMRVGSPDVPGLAYFFDGFATCLPPDFTLPDQWALAACMAGPKANPEPTQGGLSRNECLRRFDRDGDLDVDLADATQLAIRFTSQP